MQMQVFSGKTAPCRKLPERIREDASDLLPCVRERESNYATYRVFPRAQNPSRFVAVQH